VKVRNLVVFACCLVTSLACSKAESPPTIENNTAAITSVFTCPADDKTITFVVRTMNADLALWLPPEFDRPYLLLEQAPAASGARYETADVMVWLHGQEAMLTVDSTAYKACQRDAYASIWEHAKLDGVDFRATGNEPGWTLEIRNRNSLLLDYDYGESRIETVLSGPVEDSAEQRTIFSADVDGQSLTVEISAMKCTDSMSGFEFESTVVVNIDGRILQGCGRALH
jgi:putative lipoprotein